MFQKLIGIKTFIYDRTAAATRLSEIFHEQIIKAIIFRFPSQIHERITIVFRSQTGAKRDQPINCKEDIRKEVNLCLPSNWRHLEIRETLELSSQPQTPSGFPGLTFTRIKRFSGFSLSNDMATLDNSGKPPLGRYTLLPSTSAWDSVSVERQHGLPPAEGMMIKLSRDRKILQIY